MWNRRSIVFALSSAAALPSWDAHAEDNPFAALEARHGGRLGVAVLDAVSGQRFGYRADERFAMCSTFKLLLTALVLKRIDAGVEQFDRPVAYGPSDLLSHSPVTSAHVAEGHLPVGTLCEAAITDSDNAAANLLLASFGGPQAVTRFARALGDSVTRLDRIELALNDVAPGDERDTTSPSAMADNMRKIALGSVLSDRARAQLINWLKKGTIGAARLRAGFPANWQAGDKPGTGPRAETNDVAIAWPATRPPIIVSAYYVGSSAPDDAREHVLSEVGRIVAKRFG